LEKICFIPVIGNNYRVLTEFNKRMPKAKTAVVIPNWNGKDSLGNCLDSLQAQTEPAEIIVVDNGSTDGSVEFLGINYPAVVLIKRDKNYGFTGGTNPGMQKAIGDGFKYVALFNNDAIADKNWLKQLVAFLDEHDNAGIATSKICDAKKTHLDSTGEGYSIWGLPFPRGRAEEFSHKYDKDVWVFGASGGASLHRIKMLEEIGLFDNDFFAYYEDVDLSFRAQLAGWKIGYVPEAIASHEIGATSSKMKGFTTYQTMKNLPMLLWKNVPFKLLPVIVPRFYIAYNAFYISAARRGQLWPALRGELAFVIKFPKKLSQRRHIQKSRRVSLEYINSIMTHDLPPKADKLWALRAKWRKITRKVA
jgi:GT2 family glycosyltransferase